MTHYLTMPRPMPTPWVGAEMLSKLLARRVTARTTQPFNPREGRGATALYMDDQHRLLLLGIVDLPLVCHAGAALTQIPRSAALEAIQKAPSPSLLENFGEVMNVMARLLTYPDTAHVRMTGVSLFQRGVSNELSSKLSAAKSTLCWTLDIADYGKGSMMVLDLQA